jgi:hypothetical protein
LPPSIDRKTRLRKPKGFTTQLDSEINSLLYDDLGRVIGANGKLFITAAEDKATITEFKLNSLKFGGGANSFWDLTRMSKGVKNDI